MKCLVVTHNLPLFPGSGTEIRLHGLIQHSSCISECRILHLSPLPGFFTGSLPPTVVAVTTVLPDPLPPARSWFHRKVLSKFRVFYQPLEQISYQRRFSASLQQRLKAELTVFVPDLLHVASSLALDLLPKDVALPPVVVDVNDLVYQKFAGLAAVQSSPKKKLKLWLESMKARRLEKRLIERADARMVVSDRDQRIVSSWGCPGIVVPNGVDCAHFWQDEPEPLTESPRLVFIGKLDYVPNQDAIYFFLREIFPRLRGSHPDLSFQIVGYSPPPAMRALTAIPGVSLHESVPDTRPFLRGASVVVVPLRAGAGTRLKILEALACGKPVVTTTVGAEGLDLVDQVHLLKADTAQDFVGAVNLLLMNPEIGVSLGRVGAQQVRRLYDWTVAAQGLELAYRAARKTWLSRAKNRLPRT